MKQAVLVIASEKEIERIKLAIKHYDKLDVKIVPKEVRDWERFVKEIVSALANKKEVIIATGHPYIIARVSYEIGACEGLRKCEKIVLPGPCKIVMGNGKIKIFEIGSTTIEEINEE